MRSPTSKPQSAPSRSTEHSHELDARRALRAPLLPSLLAPLVTEALEQIDGEARRSHLPLRSLSRRLVVRFRELHDGGVPARELSTDPKLAAAIEASLDRLSEHDLVHPVRGIPRRFVPSTLLVELDRSGALGASESGLDPRRLEISLRALPFTGRILVAAIADLQSSQAQGVTAGEIAASLHGASDPRVVPPRRGLPNTYAHELLEISRRTGLVAVSARGQNRYTLPADVALLVKESCYGGAELAEFRARNGVGS